MEVEYAGSPTSEPGQSNSSHSAAIASTAPPQHHNWDRPPAEPAKGLLRFPDRPLRGRQRSLAAAIRERWQRPTIDCPMRPGSEVIPSQGLRSNSGGPAPKAAQGLYRSAVAGKATAIPQACSVWVVFLWLL